MENKYEGQIKELEEKRQESITLANQMERCNNEFF